MILGLCGTLAFWLSTWAVGELVLRLVFGPRHAPIVVESRPVLGLAAITVLLEAAGYFSSLRIAAWFVVPLVMAGLYVLVRRPSRPLRARRWDLAIVGLMALGAGLVPVVIAGRFTAAAITNNDATYYITVADRLIDLPWIADFRDDPSECLRAKVLFGWYWRTGAPNVIGCISVISGLSTPAATSVVTAVLVALVPAPALALARHLGMRPRSPRFLLTGLAAGASAAALFLAYQHLLGHLAAYFLFPTAVAATLAAIRSGGVRRIIHAALLVGAGLAWFADAAPVLGLAMLVGIGASHRRLPWAVVRAVQVLGLSIALAPFTALRAFVAAVRTVSSYADSVHPMFPQRGWLDRPPTDDVATVLGVDSWPPWPSAWPPSVEGAHSVVAALAGLALVAAVAVRLPRGTGLRPLAVALVVAVALCDVTIASRYLLGKVLLLAAAFAVPACAAALALRARRSWAVLGILWASGEIGAARALMAPSRWKVLDHADHDALVPALARLPAGSMIALDGFGAPADAVLDAHRAHRAALLHGLRPIQPGLDGGFYRPTCPPAPDLTVRPAMGWALQRLTSEHVSVGRPLDTFGKFRLLGVDFRTNDAILGAWAPTRGWLAAEHERDGTIFRWAERFSEGTLRVISSAPCIRLRGELRTAGPEALAVMRRTGNSLAATHVNQTWSAFRTAPLDASMEHVIDLELADDVSAEAPDAAHELALRALSIQPDWSCVVLSGASGESAQRATDAGGEQSFPVELAGERRWTATQAVGLGCSQLTITIDGGPLEIGVAFDDEPPTWHYMASRSGPVAPPPRRPSERSTLRLTPREGHAATMRVLEVAARSAACPP